jgi:hypothetical protein
MGLIARLADSQVDHHVYPKSTPEGQIDLTAESAAFRKEV